jgi:hypothetical protein
MTTTEQQLTQKIDPQGIFISVPRVKNYLNKEGLNKAMCDAINELTEASVTQTSLERLSSETQAMVMLGQKEFQERREQELKREEKRRLNDPDSVPTPAPVSDAPAKEPLFHQELINSVRLLKTRFSSESYTLVASVLCTAINELIDRGISALSTERKTKTLMVHHLLADGGSLTYSNLYTKSKVYTDALEAEQQRQYHIEWKKQQAKKQKSKVATFNGVEWKKSEPSQDSSVHGVCQAVTTTKVETGPFCTSASNVFKHIISVRTQDKGTTKFNSYRISKDVKVFCSDIVVSMLDRIRLLIRGELDRHKVKTVSPETIKSFLYFLYTIDGYHGSGIDSMFGVLDQKVSLYESYITDRRVLLAQKKEKEKEPEQVLAQ